MSQSRVVVFYISPDGSEIRYVHDDAVDVSLISPNPENATITRASHVEPVQSGPDKNKFTADLTPVGGPVLGPFEQRGLALSEEIKVLNNMLETDSVILEE